MQSPKYKGAFYVKANPWYVGGDLFTQYQGIIFDVNVIDIKPST